MHTIYITCITSVTGFCFQGSSGNSTAYNYKYSINIYFSSKIKKDCNVQPKKEYKIKRTQNPNGLKFFKQTKMFAALA